MNLVCKKLETLLLNYYPQEIQDPTLPKISKYAYGRDYHFVIKEKLKELMQIIQEKIGDVHGRAFVDSAPVLDRAWAKKSGLGWAFTYLPIRGHFGSRDLG